MKTLKQFLREFNATTKYVAVEYNEETQNSLRIWCKENGFPLNLTHSNMVQKPEDFIFHTTIFFTNSVHNIKNSSKKITPVTVEPVQFELLGADKDVPVLRVKGKELSTLRKEFEDMGMEDEWNEYKAHITLSYSTDTKFSVSTLPDFPLIFDKLVIKTGG